MVPLLCGISQAPNFLASVSGLSRPDDHKKSAADRYFVITFGGGEGVAAWLSL